MDGRVVDEWMGGWEAGWSGGETQHILHLCVPNTTPSILTRRGCDAETLCN